MQSFLGKINFLRKFIFDYAQIVKPIQEMIKNDAVYSWGKKDNDVFACIKKAIAEEFVLYNPNFKKYFLLCTFTCDTSFAAMLA